MKDKITYETKIETAQHGYVGVLLKLINGKRVERQQTEVMQNEKVALIALRNTVMRYNALRGTKIPLPIPERKPIARMVEAEAPSRGVLSGLRFLNINRGF